MGGIALGLYLLSRMKKSAGGAEGVTTDDFSAWPPEQQGQAWYAAVSTPWAPAGPIASKGGQEAQTYRGSSSERGIQSRLAGGSPDAVRIPNDANFRSLMAQGYRIAVNTDIFGGAAPLLVVYPDGFARSSLPPSWGVLRQLFAPPPGSLGTPPNGGGGFGGSVQPLGGGPDPFAALPEPSRSSARELYQSDSASLLDLEDMAKVLDKAGFAEAAAALRKRRDELKLSRQLDAQSRGGWLYTVRQGDLPFKVAQHYGGVKPGSLKELAAINPGVSANDWKGWIGGTDVLLPKAWPDPSLKPLPPLAQGQLPGGGGGGSGSSPKPNKADGPLHVVQKWYYGPGGEGPFTYQNDSEVPTGVINFGWRDSNGNVYTNKYSSGQLPGDRSAIDTNDQTIDVGVTPTGWAQN